MQNFLYRKLNYLLYLLLLVNFFLISSKIITRFIEIISQLDNMWSSWNAIKQQRMFLIGKKQRDTVSQVPCFL